VALDCAAEVEATAAAIRSAGGRAMASVGDSSSEEDVVRAVTLALEEYGGLDVCYANAGISGGLVPFFEETVERWTQVLRINLIGTFLAAKHAARAMVPHRRGSIICTASVAGLRSGAGGMPYSASKAGVISLVQTAANQLAGTGVRINAICPGLIETGMTRPIFEQARARGSERKIGQLNPLRRPGVPDEIAQTALFLASDASSYVNGQAIAVDGGLSTSHPIVIRRDEGHS
jgi:NAD(P)-dependent dehydrogenase (short-subunit alcohol dehydrogenase family)